MNRPDGPCLEGSEIVIEQMSTADLPQVMEIERISFPMPFTENLFRMELNLDVAHLYVAKKKKVSEGEGGVVGYIDYWRVEKEIHIITLAVHPDYRGRHISSALMEIMMQDARDHSVEMLTLDVRPSNEPARSLYKKFGFVESGLRKRYYQDNNEDALIMTLVTTKHEPSR